MNQPKWKLVAQLGDRDFTDYGGYFIYEDTTGVYPSEAEKLFAPHNDASKWEVRRFILRPCTFQNGILSDNKFHPDHPAWFADKIGACANYVGIPLAELIDMLVNGNTVNRALGWQAIGDYFGYENLDSYPLYFSRAEVEKRYSNS